MRKCKRCGKEVKFPIMLHETCWELEFEKVAEGFCEKYCRFPVECKSQDELDEHCDDCALVELFNLGEGAFREAGTEGNADAD